MALTIHRAGLIEGRGGAGLSGCGGESTQDENKNTLAPEPAALIGAWSNHRMKRL